MSKKLIISVWMTHDHDLKHFICKVMKLVLCMWHFIHVFILWQSAKCLSYSGERCFFQWYAEKCKVYRTVFIPISLTCSNISISNTYCACPSNATPKRIWKVGNIFSEGKKMADFSTSCGDKWMLKELVCWSTYLTIQCGFQTKITRSFFTKNMCQRFYKKKIT